MGVRDMFSLEPLGEIEDLRSLPIHVSSCKGATRDGPEPPATGMAGRRASDSAGRWPRGQEDTDQGSLADVRCLRSSVDGRCAPHLGRARGVVETRRLELLTLSLQRRCSTS